MLLPKSRRLKMPFLELVMGELVLIEKKQLTLLLSHMPEEKGETRAFC